MTAATYGRIGLWLVTAFGAALFGGTGLALLSYRRTGAFPGQPAEADVSPRAAVVKCVAGFVLLVGGLAALLL